MAFRISIILPQNQWVPGKRETEQRAVEAVQQHIFEYIGPSGPLSGYTLTPPHLRGAWRPSEEGEPECDQAAELFVDVDDSAETVALIAQDLENDIQAIYAECGSEQKMLYVTIHPVYRPKEFAERAARPESGAAA